MRGRHVIVAQERREYVAFYVGAPCRVGTQRLELRAEQKGVADPAVIQRLFAEAVACEMQHALDTIPQCEREHAVEALQCAFDAPAFERRQHDFGVRVPAPREPVFGQLLAQALEIVDFSVERDHIAPRARGHGGVDRIGAKMSPHP